MDTGGDLLAQPRFVRCLAWLRVAAWCILHARAALAPTLRGARDAAEERAGWPRTLVRRVPPSNCLAAAEAVCSRHALPSRGFKACLLPAIFIDDAASNRLSSYSANDGWRKRCMGNRTR